jgi:hypothetical protein
MCARFQASPRTSHRQAVKRIFKYLQSAPGLGLWYSSSSTLSLHGFSDADFAGCRVERKSTSVSCQFLGSSLVSWSSRKQSSVAQSTTEAEYVAAASCCSQLLWISYTLRDFGEECIQIPLLCDSTSAISVAKRPCASFQNQTHRSGVPFLERQCGERDHCVEPCPYPRSACRHFYKASRPSYICALAVGNLGCVALSS